MTCPTCSAAVAPSSRFCQSCGSPVGNVEAPVQPRAPGERRQLTVLFSDLAGSTALSEMFDPEDLRVVLHDYQAACASVIALYDGHLAKYLGDGILAYFGYPRAHEDDAQRAVRAGLGIIEAMSRISDEHERATGVRLPVRVGVHTGLVVAGDMDAAGSLEQMAIVGRTPNLAARIQSIAELDALVVSAETQRLVQGFFESRDLGTFELKGIAEPVHLHRILSAGTARSRLEIPSAQLVPFVGRARESARLNDLWSAAREGSGRVVLLSGEAGIGKSRTLDTLKQHVALETDAWLTECRCSAYFQDSAFYPIIDLLSNIVLGFQRDDSADERLSKIVGFVTQYGLSLEHAIPLLAALLGVPLSARFEARDISPLRQKQETIELLVGILLARSERQPVLFVIEDLHWADPSTLELLDRLISRIEKRPLLVLLTFRPHFTPQWSGAAIVAIRLTGLSRADGESIIRDVAGATPLPAKVVEHLLDRTDGVPLFIEELTRMVLEANIVVEREGAYELRAPIESFEIPTTLQDSLTARLDRLGTAKPLAQLASAIGRDFGYDLLEALPGPHHATLDRELARLVEAGLVNQRGTIPTATFSFKHALIRDSAYSSLLKTSRADYHRAIGETLVSSFPQLGEQQPELVARHFTQAGDAHQAIVYWMKAGGLAQSRSANVEAARHFTYGLEQLEALPETPERIAVELSLQMGLGQSVLTAKGFASVDAERAFARAQQICDLIGANPQLDPVLWGLCTLHIVRSQMSRARALAERILELAESTADRKRQMNAHFTLGSIAYWSGDLTEARERLETSLEMLDGPELYVEERKLYGTDPGVACAAHLGLALWHLGEPALADERMSQAIARAESIDHPFSIAAALSYAALLGLLRRDAGATMRLGQRAFDLAAREQYPIWIADGMIFRGWAMTELGERAAGLELIGQGRALYETIGAQLWQTQICAIQAELAMEDGDNAAARSFVDDGIARTASGESYCEAELHRLDAEVLRSENKFDAARSTYRRAIETARAQRNRFFELRALGGLLELAREQESSDVGSLVEELRALLETFPRDAYEIDIREARALLASAGTIERQAEARR
jgi:class 3 adenylate cyclase/tetratricopeptide (TPR) repeat protein